MIYSKIFCWPNFKDGDSRAEEFFAKASQNWGEFPFTAQDSAIHLIMNSNGKMCHIFVANRNEWDDSIETENAVRLFLKRCGCPEEQEAESFSTWDISLGTVASKLRESGVKVIRKAVHRGGVSSSERTNSSLKLWCVIGRILKGLFERSTHVTERVVGGGDSVLSNTDVETNLALIANLRASYGTEREKVARAAIIQRGELITGGLAELALAFDPSRANVESSEEAFRMARMALGLIEEIGQLDADNARALFHQFLEGRTRRSAQEENWLGVYASAFDALASCGHILVQRK